MADDKYNPQVSNKLFGNPPYWWKKVNNEFSEEFLFQEPDFSKTKFFGFVIKKVTGLWNINYERMMKNKKYFIVLFEYDDLYEALDAFGFINYFALKNKIDPFEILYYLILFELLSIRILYKNFENNTLKNVHLLRINKIKKFKILDNIKFDDIELNEIDDQKNTIKNTVVIDLQELSDDKYFQTIHEKLFDLVCHNFTIIIKTYNMLATDVKHYPIEAINTYYQNTLDKVIEDLKANKVNLSHINLKNFESLIKINTAELENDITHHKNILNDKLSKKNTLSQALRQPDHYLNAIFNDKIDFEVDKVNKDVKVYLKDFYKGYLIGFYEKGLLLSTTDKRKVIKELQNMKKCMSYLQNNEKIIDEIDALINFFKQDKRYNQRIPYKAIKKYTGMSKSQIKSLINAISTNSVTSKRYEDLENKIIELPLQTP
ncbi:hypothetical protein [Nitratiruptor tergarcus]|uniref:Uncharacterized protein n=1 Tax=Nitratiruptor tergarcus DSM 16512 TaxID=1069081 RepID=A0A1W1WWD1_9BACT|nr:hypothetical protein [Nitratiruptor tergarcus]SMC10053.1 hypothetical protein SAMN05660197_1884 [Nitratiruptor tergarcus DSM 16512]